MQNNSATRAPTSLRMTILATIFCNSLLWYDYALYGSLVGVIGQLFFPSDQPYVSLLAAFAAFTSGFITRPLGALFFGNIGDRHGRKIALLFSIISMSVPIAIISMLPTHQSIGVAAPVLLIAVRLLQGIALGGEAGNAAFLIEHTPDKNRGLYGSFEVLSAVIGSICGAAAAFIAQLLCSPEDFLRYGWRYPFIFGVLIGIVAAIIRYKLAESPEFEAAKKREKVTQTPARILFKEHRRSLIRAIGIDCMENAAFHTFMVFLNVFMFSIANIQLDPGHVFIIHSLSLVLAAALTVYFAHVSDNIGRKKVMLMGGVGFLICSWPIFWLLSQTSLVAVGIAHAVFAILLAASLGPSSAAMVEMFPTHVRYTGFAVARNVSGALFGGLAPTAAMWLITITDSKDAAALYLSLCAALNIVFFWKFKDKYKQKSIY